MSKTKTQGCKHQLLERFPQNETHRCVDCDCEFDLKTGEVPCKFKVPVWVIATWILSGLAILGLSIWLWMALRGSNLDSERFFGSGDGLALAECPKCPEEGIREPTGEELKVLGYISSQECSEILKKTIDESFEPNRSTNGSLIESKDCPVCTDVAEKTIYVPRECPKLPKNTIFRKIDSQNEKNNIECSVSELRGCEKEIEAACGKLREGLEYFFNASDDIQGKYPSRNVDLPMNVYNDDDPDEMDKDLNESWVRP